MRTTIAAAGIVGLGFLGAAAPAGADTAHVDPFVAVRSSAPVPGGFTAGSLMLSNSALADQALTPGSTFIVRLSQLNGGNIAGTSTLTSNLPGRVAISNLGSSTYRVTLARAIAPGDAVMLTWSDAHWFSPLSRDQISVSVESVAGGTDIDASNNIERYDNGGQGF